MAEAKYIFVTGGVASSLGKGIISASIGKLLQTRGYSVTIQKFDPYLNVDSGTLNPYEHGESFVTEDGHEGDLDLGHYERFINTPMTRNNNISSGRIYQKVINKERQGEYMGKTIQVVPHITDEIRRCFKQLGNTHKYDFIITEIGGTVGDIESLPFLESVRQIKWELGGNCVCVHLTYVPYVAAAKELKTKPTQHSVKQLQSIGIQPDVLVLRTEHEISLDVRRKVAQFCNVAPEGVIQSKDVPSIYEVPICMQEQDLDGFILRKFGITPEGKPEMKPWRTFLHKMQNAEREVNIVLVGKYVELQDAYKSIYESLFQCATYQDRKLNFISVQSEKITKENVEEFLSKADGVLIAPGSGARGIEGKFTAIHYARTHDVPTLGICLGMQCMVIEFARNVLGYKGANSVEMDIKTPYNVIDVMDEQKGAANMEKNIRIGAYDCKLDKNSKTYAAYGKENIRERHRHRYEFNDKFRKDFEEHGMHCTGINPETGLVEVVEIPDLQWFVGVQYHPEYNSTILNPNPLMMEFVKHSILNSEKKNG